MRNNGVNAGLKPEDEVSIRVMECEDIPQAAAMEREYFGEPWSKQGFREALETPYALFLAAVQGEKLIGYCGIYLSMDEGEITNVAVHRDYRCRGIGRRLLEELQRRTLQLQVHTLFLEVRVSNESAVRLYESCGFKEAGLRRDFYRNPVEDAKLMKLDQ